MNENKHDQEIEYGKSIEMGCGLGTEDATRGIQCRPLVCGRLKCSSRWRIDFVECMRLYMNRR